MGLSKADADHHHDDHAKADEHHDDHHEGPYSYVKRDPFYFWTHNDAWVHPFHEDPYCNQPKGYMFYDDPLDERTLQQQAAYPAMILLAVFIGYGLFAGKMKLEGKNMHEKVHDWNTTAALLEDEMRKARKENAELEAKRKMLLAKLQEED